MDILHLTSDEVRLILRVLEVYPRGRSCNVAYKCFKLRDKLNKLLTN